MRVSSDIFNIFYEGNRGRFWDNNKSVMKKIDNLDVYIILGFLGLKMDISAGVYGLAKGS